MLAPVLESARKANRSEKIEACRGLIAEAGSLRSVNITPLHLQRVTLVWQRKGLAAKTRRQYHNALRFICRMMMVPERIVLTIPMVRGVTSRGVTVERDVRERLLVAAPPHLRLYLLLCSDLAIRSGTAVRIAPCHYDRASQTLTFKTKGQVCVNLPVTQRIATLFNVALEFESDSPDTPFVQLLGGNQGEWKQHAYGRQLKALKQRLGITQDFTSHDLRRSTAREVYNITHDLRQVQAVLGHTNLSSTYHYLQPHITSPSAALLEAAAAGKKELTPYAETQTTIAGPPPQTAHAQKDQQHRALDLHSRESNSGSEERSRTCRWRNRRPD